MPRIEPTRYTGQTLIVLSHVANIELEKKLDLHKIEE